MFASFFRVVLVAALAASALAAPDVVSPTRTDRNVAAPINPVGVVARSLARNPAVHLTNAQRLSRGLPPNRPRAHARRALQARQSAACVAQTGTIRVILTDPVSGTTANTGYVSMDANDFGEYGFTTDRADAVSVSICRESGTTFDILTRNGLAAYPYLGGVRGFASSDDNLGNNANYVYIAGTTQAAHGPPVSGANAFSAASNIAVDYESSIWRFGANNELLASWVNTDGSVPAQEIVFVPAAGTQAFAIVGNVQDFASTYGAVDVATFYFVPA
ncbi:hypothetical protein L226DRAFT_526987 [Lentinus tigrinus ALCF2SS1-7]|uniref:Acid protease n=1 Tax=Lentinus tigrinus ALCF2SS1-6 TaxID=1328759 RepID=A0A5C2RSE7_9APHY|nr:hypothetical protein L227DRAFT_616654 [Lentinus tigrinus ALCF2SS1-6]RPD68796.1 hypothetical protein L226DRAFT_526987 [Lentinus tigrinus ALCF2SS1-7]